MSVREDKYFNHYIHYPLIIFGVVIETYKLHINMAPPSPSNLIIFQQQEIPLQSSQLTSIGLPCVLTCISRRPGPPMYQRKHIRIH